MEEEEFLAVNRITNVLNTCDEWFDDRKKWFLDRIGKTVYPNNMNCDCEECQKVLKEGLFLETEIDALSAFQQECASRIAKIETRYDEKNG